MRVFRLVVFVAVDHAVVLVVFVIVVVVGVRVRVRVSDAVRVFVQVEVARILVGFATHDGRIPRSCAPAPAPPSTSEKSFQT